MCRAYQHGAVPRYRKASLPWGESERERECVSVSVCVSVCVSVSVCVCECESVGQRNVSLKGKD